MPGGLNAKFCHAFLVYANLMWFTLFIVTFGQMLHTIHTNSNTSLYSTPDLNFGSGFYFRIYWHGVSACT